MLKVEHLEIWGFEHAIRGMRNPMNSWDRSDSRYEYENIRDYKGEYVIGPNDLKLMRKLYLGGTEHRKFVRQICISLDITAPLYWWKEFDTYKVGTVANSCSTMHKITEKEFALEDFSHEHLDSTSMNMLVDLINYLNYDVRSDYIKTKDKNLWWQMIQLLPSSYNQKRTITMNYENAASIRNQRAGHKLDEWQNLIEIFDEDLPYFTDITGKDEDDGDK